MSQKLNHTIIDGIKCYSPDVANTCKDCPEIAFDLSEDRSKSDFFWSKSRNRLFKKLIIDNLKPTGITKFLEIGSATGDFILHITENKSIEITGSEVSIEALRCAKKILPNVNFIQYDVTQGIIGEEFDLIVAFDVIEHIEDDAAAISNINKMLARNGYLIITVPQHQFMWSNLDTILHHKRRYSRHELVTKLQKNGFDISYATSFLFVLFPLMLISRFLDKGRSRTQPDKSDDSALKKRVHFPAFLNRIFDYFMRIDEVLIRLGISLPFGGTLVVIAQKR